MKTPLVLIPEFFCALTCCVGGRALLSFDLTLVSRKLTELSGETSQKPVHLLGKREQWWTRSGEEWISWIYFPDAWDASGNEGKNKESGMTSSFLVCAARRIDLLAQMGKSRFGEDQELCCRLC